MGFSDDVAEILTMLTTKDGGLPQGAVTSSFLANLVFWDYEPSLVEKLAFAGYAIPAMWTTFACQTCRDSR